MIAVFAQTRFESFHCWPDAPSEVSFLKSRHRHEFHVKVYVRVNHSDRDVEFITLKRKVDETIRNLLVFDTSTWSCEKWANEILGLIRNCYRVEVSEDGENGAIVDWLLEIEKRAGGVLHG
jgi:hypothetical protein